MVLTAVSGACVASAALPLVTGDRDVEFMVDVSDGRATDAASLVLSIADLGSPPTCDLAQPSIALPWPPNYQMQEIAVRNLAAPGVAVDVVINAITQDEPVDGAEDGNTSPDAMIGSGTAFVRGERSGVGNGRVVMIDFTATFPSNGLSCDGRVRVDIPLTKNGGQAVDDGQIYDATAR